VEAPQEVESKEEETLYVLQDRTDAEGKSGEGGDLAQSKNDVGGSEEPQCDSISFAPAVPSHELRTSSARNNDTAAAVSGSTEPASPAANHGEMDVAEIGKIEPLPEPSEKEVLGNAEVAVKSSKESFQPGGARVEERPLASQKEKDGGNAEEDEDVYQPIVKSKGLRKSPTVLKRHRAKRQLVVDDEEEDIDEKVASPPQPSCTTVQESPSTPGIPEPFPSTVVPRTPMTQDMNRRAKECLKAVMRADHQMIFLNSVQGQLSESLFREYERVIPYPMCTSEVERRLKNGRYTSTEEFIRDLRRVFSNCIRYWGPMNNVDLTQKALSMLEVCERERSQNSLSSWSLCRDWRKCNRILGSLRAHKSSGNAQVDIFQLPVDVLMGQLPEGYLDTVKHMMDLGTLLGELLEGDIASPTAFVREAVRVFRNCKLTTEVIDYVKIADELLALLRKGAEEFLPDCISEFIGCEEPQERVHGRAKTPQAASTSSSLSLGQSPLKRAKAEVTSTSSRKGLEAKPDSGKVPILIASDVKLEGKPNSMSRPRYSQTVKEMLSAEDEEVLFKYASGRCSAILTHMKGVQVPVDEGTYGTACFFEPVPIADVPDYRKIVARPMDLGKVAKNLKSGRLLDMQSFADDVKLVLRNAITYNTPGQGALANPVIKKLAENLLVIFDVKFASALKEVQGRFSTLCAKRLHPSPLPLPSFPLQGQELPAVAAASMPHLTSPGGAVVRIPSACPVVSNDILRQFGLLSKADEMLEHVACAEVVTQKKPEVVRTKPKKRKPQPSFRDLDAMEYLDEGSVGGDSLGGLPRKKPRLKRQGSSSVRSEGGSGMKIKIKLSAPAAPPRVVVPPPHPTALASHAKGESVETINVPSSAALRGKAGARPSFAGKSATGRTGFATTRPSASLRFFNSAPQPPDRVREEWEIACDKALKRLMRHEFVDPKRSDFFLHMPVATVYPGIADTYLDAIADPMDLGTLQIALEQGRVKSCQSFVDVGLLVFNNAIEFNCGAQDGYAQSISEACSHLRRYFRWLCLESLPLSEDGGTGEDSDGAFDAPGSLAGTAFTCPLTVAERDRQRSIRAKAIVDIRVHGESKEALKLLTKLQMHQHKKHMEWFASPVDLALVPDYLEHVPNPIDTGTIEGKLKKDEYLSHGDIIGDLRRVFTNALRYNSRLRAVDKNSDMICQAVEHMQPLLEQFIADQYTLEVLERVGRELVCHQREKRKLEATRRKNEELRKHQQDSERRSQELIKARGGGGITRDLKAREDGGRGEDGEISMEATLAKRRDLERRKEQAKRELELMEQQRADRLRRIIAEEVFGLCRRGSIEASPPVKKAAPLSGPAPDTISPKHVVVSSVSSTKILGGGKGSSFAHSDGTCTRSSSLDALGATCTNRSGHLPAPIKLKVRRCKLRDVGTLKGLASQDMAQDALDPARVGAGQEELNVRGAKTPVAAGKELCPEQGANPPSASSVPGPAATGSGTLAGRITTDNRFVRLPEQSLVSLQLPPDGLLLTTIRVNCNSTPVGCIQLSRVNCGLKLTLQNLVLTVYARDPFLASSIASEMGALISRAERLEDMCTDDALLLSQPSPSAIARSCKLSRQVNGREHIVPFEGCSASAFPENGEIVLEILSWSTMNWTVHLTESSREGTQFQTVARAEAWEGEEEDNCNPHATEDSVATVEVSGDGEDEQAEMNEEEASTILDGMGPGPAWELI
jgi:hypothetical protein